MAAAGAGRCAAAPIAPKPIKLAVLNLESLNRDGRGTEKQSRRFFADLLVQGLKAGSSFEVAHVDLGARDALDDPFVRRHDLALAGDYIELLNGNYHITLRLFDVPSRIAIRAWSEESPTWRGAFFEAAPLWRLKKWALRPPSRHHRTFLANAVYRVAAVVVEVVEEEARSNRISQPRNDSIRLSRRP
jgi:hypothetical protein